MTMTRCKTCCMPTTRPDTAFVDGECSACVNYRNRPTIDWEAREGELIKTTVPTRAVYQVGLLPGCGTLELGDHPVAQQLRELEIAPKAFITKNYLSRSGILPAGESLGQADRPHIGHPGEEREFGRLTISYDAGETVDLYAGHRS